MSSLFDGGEVTDQFATVAAAAEAAAAAALLYQWTKYKPRPFSTVNKLRPQSTVFPKVDDMHVLFRYGAIRKL